MCCFQITWNEAERVTWLRHCINHPNGKAHFVYSWRLEPTDKLPVGKKPCLSLRELEKQIGYYLDSQMHPEGKSMTVEELVERYLSTRIGVKPNTEFN